MKTKHQDIRKSPRRHGVLGKVIKGQYSRPAYKVLTKKQHAQFPKLVYRSLKLNQPYNQSILNHLLSALSL